MNKYLLKVIVYIIVTLFPEIIIGTDIFDSAKNGDLYAIIEYIKKGGDINLKNSNYDGDIALMTVSQKGYVDCVKLLINAKADVNVKNNYKYTALMLAVWGGHIDCVKLLINAQADINTKAIDNFTALMIAKGEGYADIVTLLKDAGAK